MALYNKDYADNQTEQAFGAQTQVDERANLSTFIKKTYQLFAASLLAASAGAYIGMSYIGYIVKHGIFVFVLAIAFLIGLHFAKRKAGLNYILLFAFTFTSGLSIAPLIFMTSGQAGGIGIVINAFVLTTTAFGGLSVFAMNTKKDFTTIGKFLFISLIVLLVAVIINYFTESTLSQLAISSVSAILFSVYILYDTQNIIRGNYETPIEGAVALYLDFINLFVALLQILGILGKDD